MEKTIIQGGEGSSDSEEDFHSARDSPSFHGDLAPFATLLAVQLAITYIHTRQRARLRTGSLTPVGLPRLKRSKTTYKEPIFKGSMQHSRDAAEKSVIDGFQRFEQVKSFLQRPQQDNRSALGTKKIPSVRTSQAGGDQSDSGKNSSSAVESTEAQPWSASAMADISSSKQQGNPWVSSDSSYGYSPKRMDSKKAFQGASLRACQTNQSPAEGEFKTEQDGSTCNSNMFQRGEGSSSISSQRTVSGYGDDVKIRQGIKEIMDMDQLTTGRLPDDSQPSTVSSSDILKASFRGLSFNPEDMGSSWSSGIQSSTSDNKQFDTPKKNVHDSVNTSIISRDGAAVPDSTVLKSRDFESLPGNEGPEQGQIDSLLLWPLGMAIEAIAFQVRLIVQAFSLVALLFNWCNSFASSRVRETMQAKERATEALSQKVAIITNVPPKMTESGSLLLKRAGWGCFAALYVCILLSMLLLPALLLDYVFVSKIVEEPVSFKEPLHFDYTLPHPTAVLSLHPSGRKIASHSERARSIPVGHKVHITVFLTLPESDYNRDLGMFQLSAELLSETGQIIKSSSRPCILRFHSFPIRMLKTFLISLPSLVGMFTESQTLIVHLMEFEEQHVITRVVRILVQPKAGMPLGQGIPEIYSADVHIESHLPWLKNTMRNWKWTVYIWTGLTLYVIEIIMILCCCRQALVPKTWIGQIDEVKADQVGGDSPAVENESGSSENQFQREQGLTHHYPIRESIPTARAVPYRRERKSSRAEHTNI